MELQEKEGQKDYSIKEISLEHTGNPFSKMFHIFGAKKETFSVPYLTEFTLCLVKTLFPRRL